MNTPIVLNIKRLHPDAHLPEYAHGSHEDAGMDLRAVESAMLYPGVPVAVRTGLAIELLPGIEAQIRPRSGLALKYAITIPNSPGTIDPSFRGEIKVILLNAGHSEYHVAPGDKIAQLVVARYEAVEWEWTEQLADSTRGVGGFGSTGYGANAGYPVSASQFNTEYSVSVSQGNHGYKVGDLVRLNSGGPAMKIERVDDGPMYYAVWMQDDGEKHGASFDGRTIKRLDRVATG